MRSMSVRSYERCRGHYKCNGWRLRELSLHPLPRGELFDFAYFMRLFDHTRAPTAAAPPAPMAAVNRRNMNEDDELLSTGAEPPVDGTLDNAGTDGAVTCGTAGTKGAETPEPTMTLPVIHEW